MVKSPSVAAGKSRGGRLCLGGARHTGIGLRGCVYPTLCGDRVVSFGGMMWQRNFIAVRVYLIRFNAEFDEVRGPETRRDGNIGCVAARSNENSTEARVSVPRVKVDPSAFKKNLILGAEISGTLKGCWMSPM